MISVATIVIDKVEKYLPIFIESLLDKCSLVSEVVICKGDAPPTFEETWKEKDIEFKMIGSEYYKFRHPHMDISQDHALSLHEAIKQCKNEIIYITDIDIFYYTNVDKVFYDLMQKYDLNIVGVVRNNQLIYSQGYFPSVVSMMLKKSELPTREWTEKFCIKIKDVEFKDKFLAFNVEWRTERPAFDSIMPKPKGHYDTGCLLHLWGLENKWKWISFITPDLNNYYTAPFLSKPKINERLEKVKLLYHQSASTGPNNFLIYKNAYDTAKKEFIDENN